MPNNNNNNPPPPVAVGSSSSTRPDTPAVAGRRQLPQGPLPGVPRLIGFDDDAADVMEEEVDGVRIPPWLQLAQQQQMRQQQIQQEGGGGGGGNTAANMAAWRERERRQRTVRVLMMFLMMLLLMDDEDAEYAAERHQKLRHNNNNGNSRNNNNNKLQHLQRDPHLFAARQQQEQALQAVARQHPRYRALVTDWNGGIDYDRHISEWCVQQADIVKDEFFADVEPQHHHQQDQQDQQQQDYGAASSSTRSRNGDSSGSSGNDGDLLLFQSSNSMNYKDHNINNNDEALFAAARRVWHYPWNTTGFYRGDWSRVTEIDELVEAGGMVHQTTSTSTTVANATAVRSRMNAVQLERVMLQQLRDRDQVAAVLPLPLGIQLLEPVYENREAAGNNESDASSPTAATLIAVSVDASAGLRSRREQVATNNANMHGSAASAAAEPPEVTLTRDDGRAAFQLFSKHVAGVKELSVVTGFVKLYDSTAAGYSTRKDVLLRVRGVLLHSIGRVSLVANVETNEMALVIDPSSGNNRLESKRGESSSSSSSSSSQTTEAKLAKKNQAVSNKYQRSRRLQRAVAAAKTLSNSDIDQVRRDALALYGDEHEHERDNNDDNNDASSNLGAQEEDEIGDNGDPLISQRHRQASEDNNSERLSVEEHEPQQQQQRLMLDGTSSADAETDATNDVWSNVVIPYPFVRDDKEGSIRNARTPASRTMPQREQALEANAAGCIFEINMDVTEVEWTVGAWRKLIARRVEEAKLLDPANAPEVPPTVEKEDTNRRTRPYGAVQVRPRRAKAIQDQALVMNMVGTIHSPNCNFTAFLNTTALRTDWDATTGKAINYSFYMMIVCLTQILILLRQLLHSQSQSTATRVSLLCIGWQTVIDAIMCLAHIYLSLAVQPLFTAFASVAFFKLLIFCVIEMKYMAIIIQARNSSNGGQPTDVLRRQVAMLHIRFYGALLAAFFLLFYAPGKYRVYYMLALYSFWVPQIILNIITEAKSPMHKYYIYGMSITRIVAPLYVFGLRNNFLKEVYPESATDPFMCQMVVLWVACQTAILIAQGKYGARFMIPARFLPPKFDYSRPIPPSMLPPGVLLDLPAPESMEDRDDNCLRSGSPKRDEKDDAAPHLESEQPRPLRHQTAETTRNRHKGSRLNHQSSNAMTTEDLTLRPPPAAPAPTPVLECSICYDDIDVRDRLQYMLAPCNHLFHADCLKQWMDVKMECPICRTELPAL